MHLGLTEPPAGAVLAVGAGKQFRGVLQRLVLQRAGTRGEAGARRGSTRKEAGAEWVGVQLLC